jgi:hypothetical protein
LERVFKFFNVLEGGVCAMCAPRDQRKSSDSDRERPALNTLQLPTFREGVIPFGKRRIAEAELCDGSFAECVIMADHTGPNA